MRVSHEYEPVPADEIQRLHAEMASLQRKRGEVMQNKAGPVRTFKPGTSYTCQTWLSVCLLLSLCW